MLFLLAALLSDATALVPCAPRASLTGSSRAITQLIQRVNTVDDLDRRTAQQYADEHGVTKEVIEQRYAATGDLHCAHGSSQANVTLNRGLLTTAAHSVFNGKAFNKNFDPSSCKFMTVVDGKEETYEIEALIDSGWKSKKDLYVTGHDWAILKLKKQVSEKITPYRIDKKLNDKILRGFEFTAIGKSVDFPDDKKEWKNNPRHYGDCVNTALYGEGNSFDIGTNCDLSKGDSGGALVTRGENPVLLGVHESQASLITGCKRDPKKKSGPHDFCWNTSSTMLDGDFLAALEKQQ